MYDLEIIVTREERERERERDRNSNILAVLTLCTNYQLPIVAAPAYKYQLPSARN